MPEVKAEDLIKLQQDLRNRFEGLLSSVRKQRMQPEAIIKVRGAAVDATKAVLSEAERQREASMKYWDQRIEHLRARIDEQRQEIKEAKAAAKPVHRKARKQKKR